MQTIFPILRYRDARAAIGWLCAAFGFVERCCIPDDGPFVRHAQLQLGENIIMLGSVRPDDGIASPQASGAATQMLAVYVKDPDAHYDRANAAGAKDFVSAERYGFRFSRISRARPGRSSLDVWHISAGRGLKLEQS